MGGLGLMAPKPPPGTLIDAGFPQLKSLIIARTGHFYYQDKDDLLWERVRKRLRETGLLESTQYVNLLNDPAVGPEEWTRLEAEITIGETFFFRYAEQFAALRDTILPEIIARKRSERRLRIWSAGCATGAEPYSLSILVNQLLGAEVETWRVGIVGTDINETFLDTARQARFGKWALRTLSLEEKERYFLAGGRDKWQLRPEFRSLVRFERHNLLSLLDGTSPLQFSEFDLILCRNVLIYFHPDTVNQVVGVLRDCLLEDGWMLLGHAEPNPFFASMMQALSLPGTVAYRRRSDGEETAAPVPSDPPRSGETALWSPILPPQKAIEGAKPGKAGHPPSRPVAEPKPRATASSQQPSDLLAQVRAAADAGRMEEADALCKRALTGQPLDAALHFYQGLIAQALRRPQEAEKFFRNGIYLDKSFAMAHYHLGLLLLAHGRAGPGRRSLTTAARIAAALPADRALDEGDGLTAGELQNLVRHHLHAAERKG
jgi:chemotaxis protein methyltransferase CheR